MVRKILFIALVIIFIFSTTMLIIRMIDNKRSDEIYNDALDIALGVAKAEEIPADVPVDMPIVPATTWVPAYVEPDSTMQQLENIDLNALREHNEEVIGWIRIPGSYLDYPVMHTDNNEYYLDHAWNHKTTSAGAIFLECQNRADLSNYNTIIYGHNMLNGSMFATLRMYTDEKFLKKRPYVYIRTDDGVYRYNIFSAFEAPLTSPVYGLSFNQAETRQALISFALENSVIDAQVEPELTDRILTLSTCTNSSQSTRWVLLAYLDMEEVPVESLQ